MQLSFLKPRSHWGLALQPIPSIQYSKVKWKVKEQLTHVWFQAFQKRIPPLTTQIELG